jgi:hypothetical protein
MIVKTFWLNRSELRLICLTVDCLVADAVVHLYQLADNLPPHTTCVVSKLQRCHNPPSINYIVSIKGEP